MCEYTHQSAVQSSLSNIDLCLFKVATLWVAMATDESLKSPSTQELFLSSLTSSLVFCPPVIPFSILSPSSLRQSVH